MQQSLDHLINWGLAATDGEIGKVEDFYFDDQTWTIRYLIVRTGGWLEGRQVLLSPAVVLRQPWESGLFPVSVTRDQVRNSPDVDTDKPVSRQHELELATYYSWQDNWASGLYSGGLWGVIPSTPVFAPSPLKQAAETSHEDVHLRSARKVKGYHIHASDGDIGHVADFIIDDQTWRISHLLADTHNWIGGKKVLVEVRHIKEVQWDDSKVVADISTNAIKNSSAINKWDYIVPGGEKPESETHISQHF